MLMEEVKEQMQRSPEYLEEHFSEFNKVQAKEIETTNSGYNKRILSNQLGLSFETDVVLQALNLVPDDPEIPIIQYKNPDAFMNLAA
jgi:hypothetical protein